MNEFSEKNLAEKLLADSGFERRAVSEIEKMIDAEMSKPEKDRDYDKIRELTSAYCEITGADRRLSEYTADKMLSEIRERFGQYRKKSVSLTSENISIIVMRR